MSDVNVTYKKISNIDNTADFVNETKLLGFNNSSTTNVFSSNKILTYMRNNLQITAITADVNKAKEDIKDLTSDVILHTTKIQQNTKDITALSSNINLISNNLTAETKTREDEDEAIRTSITTLENNLTGQIDNIRNTQATSTELGMILLGFPVDLTNKKYPVLLFNKRAYVEVPWEKGGSSESDIRNLKEQVDTLTNTVSNHNTGIKNIDTKIDETNDRVLLIADIDEEGDITDGLLYETNVSVDNLCIEIENIKEDAEDILTIDDIANEIGNASEKKVASLKLANDLSATVSEEFVRKSKLDEYIGQKVLEILAKSAS